MSEPVATTGTEIVREGQLTLSRAAQHLQTVGHEMLQTHPLTLVEGGIFSTCPDPLGVLTDRLLRSRDMGIPLVEVKLLGLHAGYERINRTFGKNGRAIEMILFASGIELTDQDGITKLDYETVGLALFSPEDMLQHLGDDTVIDTYSSSNSFWGYNGELTDTWGLPRGPLSSSGYQYENSDCFSFYGSRPMYRVMDQAVSEFPRAVMAESAITVTAEEVAPLELNSGQVSLPAPN